MPISRQFLVSCCWFVAVAVGNAQAVAFFPAPQAEAHVERGLNLARAGKLDQAETELREAATISPSNPEVLSSLATVLAMQSKLGESTEVFRKVLQLSPTDVTARRYLAANLWQLHLYPEAKQNLEILLKQKPDDGAATLLLGMVSENMAHYATAARLLRSVPHEVQKQPQSIVALARSYYHLQQTEKARATLALLSSHPAAPQAVFLGAQIADEMRDYETAEKLLNSIRSSFPDQYQLEYSLAQIAYNTGRFEQSQIILLKLIESGSRTDKVFNLLGWCYQKQAHPAEAIRALGESIRLAPDKEGNYLDLGNILIAQHSLPAALQTAKQTIKAFPNSAAAFELQGSVEVRIGQFTDAIRSYQKTIQLDPSRPNSILGLAQAQYAAGLTKDASASFEIGIKQFPRDARFPAQYAAALLKQSETGDIPSETRAEQLLRSALTIDPKLPDVHYQLGNLALKKGRLVEAQQQLEQSIKLDPTVGQAHFALARVYRRQSRQPEAAREMELYEKSKTSDSQQNGGIAPMNSDSPE
jgi:tetratricopeptide (TPR) repeat protein